MEKLEKIKDSNAYLGNGFVTVRILSNDVSDDIYKYLSKHSDKIDDVEMMNMEKQIYIPAERLPEDIRNDVYKKFGTYLNKDQYTNFYFVKYDNYISVFIGEKNDNDFLKNIQEYIKDQEKNNDKNDDKMMVENPPSSEEDNKKEKEPSSEEDNKEEDNKEEDNKEEKEPSSEEDNKEEDNKEEDDEEDVGGGLDGDDEDSEKTEKELIDYFKEQGSDDPEKDAAEYLKNMYGDPDDPDFKKELEEAEKEVKENLSNYLKFILTESVVNEEQINEASVIGRLLTGSLIRSTVRAHLAKNRMAALQMKIDKETDPEKKKKLQGSYDMISKSNFDKKGRPRAVVFNVRQALAGIKGVATGKAKLGEALKNCTTIGKIVGAAQVARAKKKDPEAFADARGKAELNAGKKPYKDASKKENDDVKKDKDGNILKQEEVTGEDGKKIKVTTHTGPKGGKFYWPDGVPKDNEHKVYVKESKSLIQFLKESLQN